MKNCLHLAQKLRYVTAQLKLGDVQVTFQNYQNCASSKKYIFNSNWTEWSTVHNGN